MFWQLVLVAAALWAVYSRWQRRRILKASMEIPLCGLPLLPVLGHAHLLAGSAEDRMVFLQTLGRIAAKRGGIAGLWMVNKLYVVMADPYNAEVVLKSCLDKDDTTMKYLREFVGNGNIFAPVSIWRPRRKILAPIFSLKNLNCFVPIFAEQSGIMVQQLEKEAGKGDVSVWKYITTYTFDAICKTTLGVDLNSQKMDHPFLEAFDIASHILAERLSCPWLYLDCVYHRLSRYKTFVTQRDIAYQFVDELITKKRAELSTRNVEETKRYEPDGMRTFLEMLMHSSGGTKGYTELELREEVLVIISAGTDTSAVGAAFTSVMLSRYPDVQEKVYQELQEVFGNSDRPATVQDLPHLKYLEAVIKETLRLYPAVPVIVREVFDDVELPTGATLVNGMAVLINIWGMHRNPAYWGEDVEEFRPERFLEPLKHPAQFMPFSYSLRNCAGSTYAMMSMKTVMSTMLRRYRLLPPATLEAHRRTEPLKVKFEVMMRHVDNFVVRIEDRKKMSSTAAIS